MANKDVDLLIEMYQDDDFKSHFMDIFEISEFFKSAIMQEDYEPSKIFSETIFLTSYGMKYYNYLKEINDDLNDSEIKFLLLKHLYHEELLIDILKTNTELLKKILNDEIISGKISYPWIFDTQLYDRFFDIFGQGREALAFDDVQKLLVDIPKGVFQLGCNLVGPYGLIKSNYKRILPPTLTVPLWHCPVPGCHKLHLVKLSNAKNKFKKLSATLVSKMEASCLEPSQWDSYYNRTASTSYDYYDDTIIKDFIGFFANCFSADEMKLILKRMVDLYSKNLRDLFPKDREFGNAFEGSSGRITDNLDKSECLQLILLLSDEQIIVAIESLIEENIIEIPATEIRFPKSPFRIDTGGLANRIECSRNGIRSISDFYPIAVSRLRKLIKKIYDTQDKLDLLDWRLRHLKGGSRYEKLDIYLYSENPKKILSNLVLDNPANLKNAFDYLRYGKFSLPMGGVDEEDRLIKKLLWKLGFNVDIYPEYINLFWHRYHKFVYELSRGDNFDEHTRELVRSSAVNFFVSLEQILGYSLSFITWVLLSDHFGDTHYKLNLRNAQEVMAFKLNNASSNKEKLIFDHSGRNTLYLLISGFSILAKTAIDVIDNNDDLIRGDSEIPEYYKYSTLNSFPFPHRILLLDIREQDREKILGVLRDITKSLSSANVCSIRNTIEHSRDSEEFPTFIEINKMCEIVSKVIINIITLGICPSVNYRVASNVDEYGRYSIKYKDCNGQEFSLANTGQFIDCELPDFSKPFVIVPCIHVGDSSELLRFEFEESSDYIEMWRNYPKKVKAVTQIGLEQV